MERVELKRKTRETDISLQLALYGTGQASIHTGIGFFDHMLEAFAVHGRFDLTLNVKGDLHVDAHHTAEDTGIALGNAFSQAFASTGTLARYGTAFIPMDEALAMCCVDVCNRPFLVFQAQFDAPRAGEFDTCLAEEFFRALAMNAGLTLHCRVLYGKNDHHKLEALFKAAAHALLAAKQPADGESELSTKGKLYKELL